MTNKLKEAERAELELYRALIRQGYVRPSDIVQPLRRMIELLIEEAITKERRRQRNA